MVWSNDIKIKHIKDYTTELPSDVLLRIFDTVCETHHLETEVLVERTHFPAQYFSKTEGPSSCGRTLKCIEDLKGVCDRWKELIGEYPGTTYHVNRLSGARPGEDMRPAAVFAGQVSDVELVAMYMPDETLDANVEWTDTDVIPFAHRYRELALHITNTEIARDLMEKLSREPLRRLITLILSFPTNLNFALDPPILNAPYLQVLNIQGFPWKMEEVAHLFDGLSAIELSQGTSLPWKLNSLARCISLSAHNLQFLALQVTTQLIGHPEDDVAGFQDFQLQLPRLKRLQLSAHGIECLMRMLMVIQSPKLELLVLRCQRLRGSPESIDVHLFPQVHIHFSPITKLFVEMPATCIPFALKWIDVSGIEELRLFVVNLTASDTIRTYDGTPIRLNKLRRLRLMCIASAAGGANPIDWLFKDVDLSATSDDANVSIRGSVRLTGKVQLPNLVKYTSASSLDLRHISVPKLRHLYLPLAEIGPRDWNYRIDPAEININKLDTLQLNIGGHVCGFFELNEDSFPKFDNLKTLILSHHITNESTIFGASGFGYSFAWPTAWRDAGLTTATGSFTTLFPKLEELKVALPRICTQPYAEELDLRELFQQIKKFVAARIRLGYPVKTLAIDPRVHPEIVYGLRDLEMGQVYSPPMENSTGHPNPEVLKEWASLLAFLNSLADQGSPQLMKYAHKWEALRWLKQTSAWAL